MDFYLFTLEKKTRGDTYEIAYADSYTGERGDADFWSEDSLYFHDDDDGMNMLAPYLNEVFEVFAYYGPQRVTLSQWEEVERAYRADEHGNPSLAHLFDSVREWLKGNGGKDWFWILGI